MSQRGAAAGASTDGEGDGEEPRRSLSLLQSLPLERRLLARVQPRLQLLGSVVPNGFCSGNVTPTTTVSPVSDLTFLAFPCSLNTWAGFEMRLEARGHDISEGHVSQVCL